LSNIPELTEHLIQDTDELVILASDGLWDKVDSQQAVALARSHLKHQGTTAESCAKMLVSIGKLSTASIHEQYLLQNSHLQHLRSLSLYDINSWLAIAWGQFVCSR